MPPLALFHHAGRGEFARWRARAHSARGPRHTAISPGAQMYQLEMARSGRRLFFIRGLYIYTVIAIGTLIVWRTGIDGPFADAGWNCAWFWLSLGVAAAGALVRAVTSGFAALGT